MELDTQHREYLPWSLKAGVKVVVHDRDEYPNLEDEGFLVGPGLAASIVLSKVVVTSFHEFCRYFAMFVCIQLCAFFWIFLSIYFKLSLATYDTM